MAKYFWGSSDPFPMSLSFFFMALGSVLVSTAILSTPGGEPAIKNGCNLHSVRYTVLATILYFFVWYQLLAHQTALKFVVQSNNSTAHRTAERIVGNTLEQMGPFLVLLWLFTVYVDDNLGGRFGILYSILVLVYAFAYARYGHFTVCVEISTQPRYTMLLYMATALVREAFWPDSPSLGSILPSSLVVLSVVLFVVEFVWTFPGWMMFGLPLAMLNVSNNPNTTKEKNKSE